MRIIKPIATFIYYPIIKKYISSFKNFGSKILDLNTNKICKLKINVKLSIPENCTIPLGCPYNKKTKN